MILVTIPLRTENSTNRRDHWGDRAKRAARDCSTARDWLKYQPSQMPRQPVPKAPCRITLTRLSPGPGMDDDGVQAALKNVRDGVADFLGMDDGSPLLTWQYGQRKAIEFGVEIKIEEGAP